MAATCGSLSSLFEAPLPENPTLIESLSWSQMKPRKPIEVSSFAEIFGELYFQEKKPEPPSSTSPALSRPQQLNPSENDQDKKTIKGNNPPPDSLPLEPKARYNNKDPKSNGGGGGGFASKNSDSLQLCTEGLGSESSDDVDDLLESGDDWSDHGRERGEMGRRPAGGDGAHGYVRASKTGKGFPPPISIIGRSGKPCVSFRSYREDGRFVLREIRIPTQEWLHASRQGGRLKLQFIHPNQEGIAEEEEEKEEEEVEEGAMEGDKKEVSEGQSQQG